ncbi:MAG: hypothetical protein NTAFB01_44170 [Nitrospira sp.]
MVLLGQVLPVGDLEYKLASVDQVGYSRFFSDRERLPIEIEPGHRANGEHALSQSQH